MDEEKELQLKQYKRMTEQPIASLLVQLSIPTIISMMVTNIYNLVDTAFVGTLGTSQSGATGVVFGYMALLQAVAFMCGQGGGSIMSRKLGEKDIPEATKYSSTSFFLSLFLGFLLALASCLFLAPLLRILGSTDTIMPYSGVYILCIMMSAPFSTAGLTMNNLLRYEGKAKLGTVGLMVGAVVNIGLDALLMFVFRLGIWGAGLATAVSQVISFGILLSMFLRGKTQTKIALRFVAREIRVYGDIIATGFPSLLRQGLNSVATMLLNRLAGEYGRGDEAVSAMSIVSRISFFSLAVAIGIGQGFQPISSFNYGAGKKERVRKAYWATFWGSEIMLTLISIPIFIFAPQLVQKLRDDREVIVIGTRALRLMCAAQLFIPFTTTTEMGFQSTGAKLYATICSSLRSGVIFIPTLLILAKMRGIAGIQEAQPVSFILSFLTGIYFCRVFLKRLRE